MDAFIISDGNIVHYMRSPDLEKKLPPIPADVDTVNLTWEAPAHSVGPILSRDL